MGPFIMMIAAHLSSGGGSTVVTPSDWSTLISALTSQVSVATVVGALAAAAGAAIGLVFMWWGARKAVGMLMGAFRKGKLSV